MEETLAQSSKNEAMTKDEQGNPCTKLHLLESHQTKVDQVCIRDQKKG